MERNNVISTKRMQSETQQEVSCDVMLPDYRPEIRRVISVEGTASCEGKYLSGDELEIDGSVTYTVLYIGSDGDGAQRLSSLSETSPFTAHIPMKETGEDGDGDRYTPADIAVSLTAEQCSCRVSAPRKAALSSRLRIGVLSSRECDVSLRSDKAAGEVRRKSCERSSSSVREYRASFECGGEMSEKAGASLVSAKGSVCVSDARVTAEGVKFTGEAYIDILMRDESGGYGIRSARAAVDEVIPMDSGAKTDAGQLACVFPEVTMTEVNMGDDGTVTWSMEYDAAADVMTRRKADVTEDAYLPGARGEEVKREKISVLDAVTASNGRLTLSHTAAAQQGSGNAKLGAAWGRAECDKPVLKNGRVSLSGKIKLGWVLTDGDDAVTGEGAVPFRYETEAKPTENVADVGAGADDGDTEILLPFSKCSVTLCDLSARHDGDKLSFVCETGISMLAMREREASALTSIARSAEEDENDGTHEAMLRVYVPDDDEDAWSVEKKFRLGHAPEKHGGNYIIG